jgi:uncharacterized membrane protein YfcA
MSPLFALEGLGLGTLIGLSLGALGAGGSILTVPILVYVPGMPAQSAAGTSLAIVGLNAAAGALDHLRRGRSLPRTGLAFGLSGLLGALSGAWPNHAVRADLVLALFALLMPGAAWSLLRRRAAPDAGDFSEHYGAAVWPRLVAAGMAVGLLTGLFGVGGSFLIVPALALVLGLPMRLAVGTSLLAIALNALWGVLGYPRFGGPDWALTGLFALGGLVGVLLGGKLAGRLPERALRSAFAGVIVAVAAYTFVRSAAALAGAG